jgi:threonine dehydratase
MDVPSREQILAAAERLRGQVVATPLIGGLLLGGGVREDLRVKPEVLQPSGSLYFRGAMHWLLRQLGGLKGVVLQGTERAVLAGAVAAALHRLPMLAFTVGEPQARVWSQLKALRCEVRPRASADEAVRAAAAVRAAQGYALVPGVGQADYAAGLATAGLELAAELPTDTELVVVSPAELAPAVALGLAAGGAEMRVEGIDEHGCALPAELREDAATALRLDLGVPSLAALHRAAQHTGGPRCAVLAC